MGKLFGAGASVLPSEKAERLLSTMVKVAMEAQEDALYEMLQILHPLFEKSILSIVKISGREVIASTEEPEKKAELGKMACGLKEPLKEGYFLRNQKNNLWFRRGIGCIRIIFLPYAGKTNYMLVVEQEEKTTVSMGRTVGLLSMAVHLYVSEKEIQELYYVDPLTRLLNRDALIQYMKESCEKTTYIGMFFLCNSKEMLLDNGYIYFDNSMCRAAGILKEVFPENVYRVGDDKVAVCLEGEMYENVSRMQNAIDRMVQEIPEAVFSATLVSSKISDDLYKLLYVCEKTCLTVSRDTVLVVRGVDGMESNIVTENVYMDSTYDEKEDKAVVINVEEVKISESSMQEEKQAEEDLNFFYHIPDEDEIISDL